MAKKQTVSFSIDTDLADQFRAMTSRYYGKLGLCFSAALLQFLEAPPDRQAQYIQKVFDAEVKKEMLETIELAKEEQFRRIKASEKGTAERGRTKKTSSEPHN